MTKTKISFVVPAYNETKYIGLTLNSILKQRTKNNFEVIVVDNDSTDGTGEFVRKNYPQVKLLVENSRGTSAARNRGAEESCGEFLAFFDADIIIPPEWTEKMLEYFKDDKKMVAVGGPYRHLNLNRWQKFWEQAWYYIGVIPTRWFFADFLKIGSILMGGNFAVKKNVFNKIGGFDVNFIFYGDDTNLAKRLLKYGSVKFYMDLFVFSSSRRVARPGKNFLINNWVGFWSSLGYVLNFYSTLIFNKPIFKKHKDIR